MVLLKQTSEKMIRSMTGFGSARRRLGDIEIVWEMKTVNHRYLDIALRVPREWSGMEPLLRERIAAKLYRGKVDCSLKLEPVAERAAELTINTAVLTQLGKAIDEVQTVVHGLERANVLDVLRWEGVLSSAAKVGDEWQAAVLEALSTALDELLANRQREGASLKTMILARCDELERVVGEVGQRLPAVREHWRDRLLARIEEMAVEVDSARLEQEILFTAQKMDVAEELDRLKMHIQEVRNTLDTNKSIGRRLDFLMQELHRETNTIASKSVDSSVTQLTVDMKVLIEQMREQVQNIE